MVVKGEGFVVTEIVVLVVVSVEEVTVNWRRILRESLVWKRR